MSAKTLLDVVKYCNNHSPLGKDSGFLQLTTAATTAEGSFDETHVGFVPDFVRLELIRLGLMSPSPSQARREMHEKADPHRTILIQASDSLIVWEKHEVNQAQRSRNFRRMILELKAKTQVPAIKHVLDGWRDEEYAIYDKERDLTSDKRERKVLCHVERAACALFGFATFGVHCTGYTEDYKVWVPRRSKTKQTWPGYLDNTVAGGITAGESQLESMLRECAEEAGLEEDFVRPRLKSAGAISYFYKSEAGLCQPEVEYTYDILLPVDKIPQPVDGEAESFELMDFAQVIARIRNLEFKPNSALVLIDFYIRHGLITPETEPDYLKIISLMHTVLGLPVP